MSYERTHAHRAHMAECSRKNARERYPIFGILPGCAPETWAHNRAVFESLFDLVADTGLLRRNTSRGNIKVGAIVGTVDGKGYLHVNIEGRFYRLHRIVFLMHFGWLPDQLDHRNRKRQDNRPNNLRPATTQQNAGNTWDYAHNTSGLKGVSLNSISGLWHAQIKLNGKQTYLGRSDTKHGAFELYRRAAEIHFGNYARVSNA